jgi:hypothetical protein
MLLTGCSSPHQAEEKPSVSSSSSTTSSPSPTPTPTSPINATRVVAAFSGAGYKCTSDVIYAICTTGPTSVWVLTGSHPRPPVVSLHASGPVDTSSSEIAEVLPEVLELAHINQGADIATWFGQQKDRTTAQYTAGDWLVEYSAEVGTEEPGTHLTLTDKLCTVNCQAE